MGDSRDFKTLQEEADYDPWIDEPMDDKVRAAFESARDDLVPWDDDDLGNDTGG